MTRIGLCLAIIMGVAVPAVWAQSAAVSNETSVAPTAGAAKMETTSDWNRRLEQLVHSALSGNKNGPSARGYRIGPNDLLTINVLEAPDLSQPVRVAEDGEISLPLLGTIKAAGLTPRELELVLQALLRRTYMKNPHVSVTVTEMESHTVSVIGAVKNPGSFQIRGTKTLLEMLSQAGGLAPDAGNAVLVMRGAGLDHAGDGVPRVRRVSASMGSSFDGSQAALLTHQDTTGKKTIEINLKQLLDSGNSEYNIPIYPGDIVKVKVAGIVYVVGNVNHPGGFPVPDNEHMTVLQAVALGGGIAPNAAKNRAAIIRVAKNGKEIEIPIRLDKILVGKAPDIPLRPRDVLFVPKNGAKAAGRAVLDTFSKWIVWRGMP